MRHGGGDGSIHTDESGECRPRTGTTQHDGIRRGTQQPSRTLLNLARPVSGLATLLDLLGKRGTAQHLRQAEQA